MKAPQRIALLLAGVAGFLAFSPAAVGAHPLGNFTVNQHTALVVHPDSVAIDLVIDMAEIPAFQTRKEIDADGDKRVSASEASSYRARECTSMQEGLSLTVDGAPVALRVTKTALSFPPGQAGLPTLRLTCLAGAPLEGDLNGRRLEITNDNHADRAGWREMTAVGRGVRLADSDVPTRSTSDTLRAYPDDLLASPLDVRHARVSLGPADPAAASRPTGRFTEGPTGGETPQARGADRFTATFTDLVARQDLTIGFALLALAAAIILGALHSLAPGHGKTVIAAYLVGEGGSLRQAATLGLSVTVTHTAGVLVLGLILSGSAHFVPERLYPWLGVTSGGLLAAIGVNLFIRARRRGAAGAVFGHSHGHGHHHHHHPHSGHDDHHHNPPMSRRTLLAMGAAGGMVPSPSALVVLLGAIALGRTWFGILLVLGYGAGMALTLIAAGLLLVRARGALEGKLSDNGRWARVARWLPVGTATLVIVAGVGLAARAVVAT